MSAPQIPAWLGQLRHRFSPTRIRISAEGASRIGEGGGASTLALVGRELCLFLTVNASHVPVRQRASFVELAIRRAAPFSDPEFDVLWSGGHAAAWYWSRSRVRALAPPLAAARVRYRAEAMFRGEPHTDEHAELLSYAGPADDGAATAHGIEGRLWRGGRLLATRWWPRAPEPSVWQAFLRGAGGSPFIGLPQPSEVGLCGRALAVAAPGATRSLAGGLDNWRSALPAAMAVAGTAALALLAWQTAGLVRTNVEARRLEARIERVSTRLEPVIRAREAADRAAGEASQLLALRPVASQTRLLAEVGRTVPGTWQLAMWHLPSPDVLELTLRIQQPDVPAIVAALEASPLFQDVTPQSSTGKDELKLQARLTPLLQARP